MFEINKTDGPFAGVFAYRFIKKSKALLAFTHFDFTCILELDGAFSATTQKFYAAVWKRLDNEKIPYTFHWGTWPIVLDGDPAVVPVRENPLGLRGRGDANVEASGPHLHLFLFDRVVYRAQRVVDQVEDRAP